MCTTSMAPFLGAAVLALAAATAGAQDLRPFADLEAHLRTGDGVRIDTHDGTRASGTVVSVSAETLVITSAAGRQTFTAATTTRVARLGDSVLNGALVGLLPGFLLGLQLPRATSDQRANEGSGIKSGLITAVIGAAIGMAADGARDGESEIYSAPPARVSVAPFVGRGTVGATAAVRW
jgi:hypothetical protein